MYRTPNPINNAVAFLPIHLEKSQIKGFQTFYELKNCGIKIMCSMLHHLFTSILLHSVISLSLMEQTGRVRFLHLTIKGIEHFSDGTFNKWVYYRWLWPSRAVLFHGQMTINSVKWMKKSNENGFCSEKHYLCTCCSSSIASPRHLTMAFLEAECGCNGLFMYVCK